MNRTTVRLTENDINNLVAEAATRIINEIDRKTLAVAAKKALDRSKGDESAGKASKAAARKVVKKLAQDKEFIDLPKDQKLDRIKRELHFYYRNLAGKLGKEASGDPMISDAGIERLARTILTNYLYSDTEHKWKAKDMPDVGVDYSELYDDQLFK